MKAKTERDLVLEGKSILCKAADDEPVFILRAQDKLASEIVEIWAALAAHYGCPVAKVLEARALAEQMRLWPNRKYPD